MIKSISLLVTIFVIFASVIPVFSGASESQSPIKITFDNKNATVKISVNNTQFFLLKFTKVYVATTPYFMSTAIAGMGEIRDMNIETIQDSNREMGNFTKITMWKSFEISGKMPFHKKIEVTITIDFYIAEKEYMKKDILVNRSMIRYDTRITTSESNNFVFLEEHMIYGNVSGEPSRVFECGDHSWKMMNKTEHVMKHYFGSDHLGMVGFGDRNVSFRYMWNYEEGISTLYSYDGTNFKLFFGFENNNGTIIQDPYIALPLPISGNLSSIIEHPEKIISYIMDHALSFAIGLTLAVVVVFSAPLLRRRRL